MVKLSSDFAPMLEGCLANRTKWVSIEEGKEDKDASEKEDENCLISLTSFTSLILQSELTFQATHLLVSSDK